MPLTHSNWEIYSGGEVVNIFSTDSTKKRKAMELGHIKALVNKGDMSHLHLYKDSEGRLALCGLEGFGDTKIFVLNGGIMIANKQRVSHLKAWLEKFAEQQGFTLKLITKKPKFSREYGRIVYWPFKFDFDDSDIVSQTLRNRAQEAPEEEAEYNPYEIYQRFVQEYQL